MKHRITQIVTVLMLLMAQSFISKAEVKNSLTMKNNTDENIRVAYVWYNSQLQGFESRGWEIISPYGELRLDLHDLKNFSRNIVYVYAEGSVKNKKIRTWDGNSEFRVGDAIEFDIYDADKFTKKLPTRKFNMVAVYKGDTPYTFNP